MSCLRLLLVVGAVSLLTAVFAGTAGAMQGGNGGGGKKSGVTVTSASCSVTSTTFSISFTWTAKKNSQPVILYDLVDPAAQNGQSGSLSADAQAAMSFSATFNGVLSNPTDTRELQLWTINPATQAETELATSTPFVCSSS
jgi:hypothetical protein